MNNNITYCWNSMLIKDEETFAIISKAVVERTMEVSPDEGLETEDCALSTILI